MKYSAILCAFRATMTAKARMVLETGIHDPELFEKIAHLNAIINDVSDYEKQLIADNMDVD